VAASASHGLNAAGASNVEALFEESLRRYLESHQEAVTEQFIREDVEWGLHGRD
jgi:hypothetical protein